MPSTKMRDGIFDLSRFLKGPCNIDQLLVVCDEIGIFDDCEQAAMVAQYKKSAIRGLLRQMGRHSPTENLGEQIEWVNLIIQNPDGTRGNVYQQLAMFDESNFVQVIRERMGRVKYWQSEVSRLISIAMAKFGPGVQHMLSFDDLVMVDAEDAG